MKLKESPEKLQPYLFHSVEMSWTGSRDAEGDCPFCGREAHLHVSQSTGQFHCKVCGAEGNVYTFLQMLWEHGDYLGLEDLAAERRLFCATLEAWGVKRNPLSDEWMLAAYNRQGKLSNLYRYATVKGKRRLLGTPGCKHHLFGLHLFDDSKPDIDVCEGPFDAMALWETLAMARNTGSGLVRTSRIETSLLSDTNVVAAPGCEVFREEWTPLFAGKNIRFWYDNDPPRKHPKTDKLLPPAGYSGCRRAVGVLASAAQQPSSVAALHWGPDWEARGHNPTLPDGYDVRDALVGGPNDPVRAPSDRLAQLRGLLGMVGPVPGAWLTGAENSPTQAQSGGVMLTPRQCSSYRLVQQAWRKALRWSPVLDCTLSVMLATVASTKSQGDQLWLRVIGPPGSAKSTLCEAISISEQYAFPTSVQKGFHSGYVGERQDKGKDASLIPMMDGKTVIVKDGDTLLSSSNRDQVLSELRDIYDGTSRAHYRNRETRVYTGLRITFIIAGTKSLRRLNRSFLGDRFLDCIIYDRDEENHDFENEILTRKAFSALRQVRAMSDGTPESQTDERLAEAMRLTGGYVEWLRENAEDMLAGIECPEKYVYGCIKLGQLVSYMRARPDKNEEEEDYEVELATRLTSQLVRLSNCLALVMNKPRVDKEVMARTARVALDTSRGIVFSLIKELAAVEDGAETKYLALRIGKSDTVVLKYLKFMRQIGIVRTEAKRNKAGVKGRNRHVWTIPYRVRDLYKSAVSYAQLIEE